MRKTKRKILNDTMKQAHMKGIVFILLVAALVGLGFYTEDKGITGAAETIFTFPDPDSPENEFRDLILKAGFSAEAGHITINHVRTQSGKVVAGTATIKDPAGSGPGQTIRLSSEKFLLTSSDGSRVRLFNLDGTQDTTRPPAAVPEFETTVTPPPSATRGIEAPKEPEPHNPEPGILEGISARSIFQTLDRIDKFAGVGYYSQFFFEEEDLDAWREEVDRVFATTYLGTEYWSSEICSLYADRAQEGVAYFEDSVGLAGLAAHVEATRSVPIEVPPGLQEADETGIIEGSSEYLYKITFNVRNGQDENDLAALENMEFNIILKGSREVRLYQEDIVIDKGEQFGATGRGAIVQFSNHLYDTICIQFDRVPSRWTLDDNELCNVIPAVAGTPTTIAEETETPADKEKGIVVNPI